MEPDVKVAAVDAFGDGAITRAGEDSGGEEMESSGDSMRATRCRGGDVLCHFVAGGWVAFALAMGSRVGQNWTRGGVLGVAGVAGSRGWNHFGGFDLVEAKKAQLPGKRESLTWTSRPMIFSAPGVVVSG